jgi:hypothetical protein
MSPTWRRRHSRPIRLRNAVLYNLQIIGEAVGKIRAPDPQFAAEHPDIAWDLIYGMRDRLVHKYFEVDLEVVWRGEAGLTASSTSRFRCASRLRDAPSVAGSLPKASGSG